MTGGSRHSVSTVAYTTSASQNHVIHFELQSLERFKGNVPLTTALTAQSIDRTTISEKSEEGPKDSQNTKTSHTSKKSV